MLGPRGDEQQVARPERVPLAVVKEDAAAADDDVNLVLGVRRRRPRQRGEAAEGNHGLQGAALHHADRLLTGGAGDTRLSLGETDHTATASRAHRALLMPPNNKL